MFKRLSPIIFIAFIFTSCDKGRVCNDPDSDIFNAAKSSIFGQTYSGIFRTCNAEPEMTNFQATATVTSLGGDAISVQIVTDSLTFMKEDGDATMLDTTLFFTMECCVNEGTIPSIDLINADGEATGYYNGDGRLSVGFIYGPCGKNAWLEGY